MSTSNQQTLTDSGANERPPMLRKGNYIPWETSKAKKATKNHDPLALVAHSSASLSQSHANSSYSPQPYYVTHPSLVANYEDEYQGELQVDSQEDKLTTAMMLLARAITQIFSTPTNNRLRTSSNTRNQAVIQDGRVDIQTKNAGYGDNDETLEELTAAVIMMARIQSADDNVASEASYDAKDVRDSKVKRALFTTTIAAKSKNLGATFVVAKFRLSVAKTPTITNKVIQLVLWIVDSRIFCDGNLEVAFRSNTCYVWNLEGDDLLIGSRESNLYTISISELTASSPVCLTSKATSTKSWLWHQRLSHLNFGSINQLTSKDLVDGLLKLNLNKKIMETIHVKFDELTAMASKCNNLEPEFNYNSAANTLDNKNTSSSSSIVIEEHKAPQIVSSSIEQVSNEPNTPVLNENANEDPSNMHEFLQTRRSTDKWTKNHPIEQVIGDPLKPVTTRRHLHTNAEVCMYALTVSTTKPKNIKEAMLDASWLESITDGFGDPAFPSHVYRLKNALYGLKQAHKACLAVPVFTQGDDLISCLNKAMAFLLAVATSRLKDQIQDKVFVITNDLHKLKGKEIVDNAAQLPNATTIVPGMFKLDSDPLAPSENLGKLNAKANIGIFVGYAPVKKAFRIYNRRTQKIMESKYVTFDELTMMDSEQFSSGHGLQLRTIGTSSLGIVPIPIPHKHFNPPTKNDWDRLFQPMFNEYFNPPPSAISLVQVADTPRAVDLANSPVSTSIDHDEPSTSIPLTQEQEKSPIISQGVEESPKKPHFLDDPLHETLHEDSSSQGSSSNMWPSHTPFEVLGFQISKSPRGIFINLSNYALEIIKKYGMISSDPVVTPMVEKGKLDEDLHGKLVDPTHYHDPDHAECQDIRQSTYGSAEFLGENFLADHLKRKKALLSLVLELYFVRTEYELTNIYTKALPQERFNFLVEKLGMKSMSPEMLKSLAEEEDEEWW
uniref:Integrase, catalytic region, zinc finger, CCHC-type, peptidase aspartic, catalytic n=1 Tax=Tanacetum cinerariifolium TaxID=118510 RepID=A0A6L2LLZ5_TANCI|nr:integrase, catalytic region, zinc finger, CCHC-type, peptidase aspartic, catalytic [Tanacetum cinerariifolium]